MWEWASFSCSRSCRESSQVFTIEDNISFGFECEWVCVCVCVCVCIHLLHWVMFLVYLNNEGFYHERMLYHFKCFFLLHICWDDQVILYFILLMQCITNILGLYWTILAFQRCIPLVMLYNLLNVFLNSVCWYFSDNLCIYFQSGYWPVVFFSCNLLIYLVSG